MEELITLTQAQIERVFAIWNKEASEKKWPLNDPITFDTRVQAEYFVMRANEIIAAEH